MNDIKERIEALETERFYLAMKDRWTDADYCADAKMFREILELKQKLVDNGIN